MIWVVNGNRLKKDYQRFSAGIRRTIKTSIPNFFLVPYREVCFPKNWIHSTVPVIFDFLGTESFDGAENLKKHVHLVRPKGNRKSHSLMILSRDSLVSMASKKEFFGFPQEQGH
jgi:hypothetical protein